MKTAKKIVVSLSLTTLLTATLLALIILAPQNLFANSLSHNNFTIFSNKHIESKLTLVLDNALNIVSKSELYTKTFHYDIFLANNTFYNSIDSKIFGPAMSRSIDNNIILKVKLDIDNNELVGEHNTRNLTQTIAHEMVHCLQMKRYGKLRFNPFHHPELWKLEGYPEYISMKNNLQSVKDNLKSEVKKLEAFENTPNNGWYETQKGQFDPIVYFRGRLMVEYLMDKKGLSYDQVLSEKITAGNVYSDMIKWAAK